MFGHTHRDLGQFQSGHRTLASISVWPARAPLGRPPPAASPLSHSQLPRSKRCAVEWQLRSELLLLLSNAADLANAVHWLPPGILWAGRFPPWLVGLLGTVSSLLRAYLALRADTLPEVVTS